MTSEELAEKLKEWSVEWQTDTKLWTKFTWLTFLADKISRYYRDSVILEVERVINQCQYPGLADVIANMKTGGTR